MKKSNQQKVSKLALGLYILSFFMLVMTGYSIYTCYVYVASIVEQGFVISENLNDTISYYLSSVTPYAFYTICLGAMAYIVQQMKKIVTLQSKEVVEIEPVLQEAEETDLNYEALVNDLSVES